MITPGLDHRGHFLADPLGEIYRESGIGQAGGVQGKGDGLSIPLGILNGSALAALTEPPTPHLSGPQTSLRVERHFYRTTFQTAQEIHTPSLVLSVYFFHPAAEIVRLSLIPQKHLPRKRSEFPFRGIPYRTARGIGNYFSH